MDLLQYQEYLANTAHQREVADLKAAGLNPILSAHGSGAAVPNVLSGSGSGGESAVAGALKVANSAVKTSAKAVDAVGSVGSSLAALGNLDLSSSPLQAIETVEQASSGSSNSGFGNYVGTNGILANFLNDYVEEHGDEKLFGLPYMPTVQQTADLYKFFTKKPGGHALTDEEWQAHESAKSNFRNSKKPWSSSTARRLEDDAAVARLLLGR